MPVKNADNFGMYFSDIWQCFHPVTKKVLDIKNPAPFGSTRGRYIKLLVNILGFYILWCKQEQRHKQTTTTDRIPELPRDRCFLDLSEICFYMVHFGLRTFFWKKLQANP